MINEAINAQQAQDAAPGTINSAIPAGISFGGGFYPAWLADGLGFQTYPYLAEMAQRPEFRKPCDVFARECVREWIKITHAQDEDNEDGKEKIQKLEASLKKFKIRELIHKMTHNALIFGVGHIWLNVKNAPRTDTGQNIPLILDPRSVKKGMLCGFTTPEAIWCTPNTYNADNPLHEDYYKPRSWWCQGKLLHHTRLLQMIPYEVSDLFKPSFNFGGLSMMQLIKADVHNYLRIRNSTANITANFSKLVLKTPMAGYMAEPGYGMGGVDAQGIAGRANFLQNMSEGQDTIIADKETEEISILATPLGGLSDLQVKAMEKMASFPGIPLVKLFGITPSGLNASSEEEIRVFYDEIASFQETHIRPILEKIFKLIQLHEFGEIDDHLGFEFAPLWQMSEAEQVNIQKQKADIDAGNISQGIISPEEARERQNKDKESIYAAIDLSTPPPHNNEDEGDDEDDNPLKGKHAQDDMKDANGMTHSSENGRFTGNGGNGMSILEQKIKELEAKLEQAQKDKEQAQKDKEQAQKDKEQAQQDSYKGDKAFQALQEKYKDFIDNYLKDNGGLPVHDMNARYNPPQGGRDPRDVPPMRPVVLRELYHQNDKDKKNPIPLLLTEGYQNSPHLEGTTKDRKNGNDVRGEGRHHIEFRHGEEIRKLKFDDALHFVRYISNEATHDYIDRFGDRILGIEPLGAQGGQIKMEVVQDKGGHYVVKTAYPAEFHKWRDKVANRLEKIGGRDSMPEPKQIMIRNIHDLVPEGEITQEEREEHEAEIQKIEAEKRARGEEITYDENPWLGNIKGVPEKGSAS